jgi:hypothetical protein
MRETGFETIEKGEKMASPSQRPFARFFRSLLGFPEGKPGSCACSGESAAAEPAPREKENAADKACCEKDDGPEIAAQPVAGCCG